MNWGSEEGFLKKENLLEMMIRRGRNRGRRSGVMMGEGGNG